MAIINSVSLFRKLIIFVFILSGLFACKQKERSEIRDLIEPVVITAGQNDTLLISDLFYARTYPLQFLTNPQLDVRYEQENGELILRAHPSFEGYALLQFKLIGETYAIPVFSRIKQKHVFTFKPTSKPRQRMNIMGTFNDWNRNGLPMQDNDGDGIYEIELELDPGQYLYQFVIDRKEIWDPQNPHKVDNGFGSFNSVVLIPRRHTQKTFLHNAGYVIGEKDVILTFVYTEENDSGYLKRSDIRVLLGNKKLPDTWIMIKNDQINVKLPRGQLNGFTPVRLVVSRNGLVSNLQTVFLEDGVPSGKINKFNWQDAIIYSLMIDRFYDGDKSNSVPVVHDSLSPKVNYMGGDLQGILTKLHEGYFDSLGVNTFWLFPVNQNTNHAFREYPPPHRYYSAYHGYWPTSSEKVEEHFGDMDLLKMVVKTAHEHSMKVLLDFTANHVHKEHPFFRDHRDWFGTLELPDGRKNLRLWDEHRLTTWFEPYLPSFDYLGSEEALETMTDNAVWWIKQIGADGFRHDAVKHVPNKFWRTLTRKMKQQIEIPENRRLYQIGETFGSYRLIRSYVNNGQLNAQFNFNLYDTALYVFLHPEVSFSILDKELQKAFAVYGVNNLMGNIMDSHDKVRYMAYADNDIMLNSSESIEIGWTNPPRVDHATSYEKEKLYLTYLLTIPGIPTIYYGDEIGMTGAADPDNRRMMRFGDALQKPEKKMLRDVSKLIHLRRKHSALRYGDFQTLLANENCFVYLRTDMHERILVVLNKSNRSQDLEIRIPQVYHANRARDLLSGDEARIQNNVLVVTIPSLGEKIYRIL